MINLIVLLVSAIPAIVTAIISYLVRKVGTAGGSIAAFLLLTTAFIAALKAVFDTLATYLTAPAWISTALGMFLPANFSICVAAFASAHICRTAYDMARVKLEFVNNAS
ncbi:MAG: hypothetical protein ABIV04_03040 [Massilia sp.]